MNLPNFSTYIANLKLEILSKGISISIPVNQEKLQCADNIQYEWLDFSIGGYWDYCVGQKARPEDFAENNKRIKEIREKYLERLSFFLILTNNKVNGNVETNNHWLAGTQEYSQLDIDREISALFYFLYKIDSMMQVVDNAREASNLSDYDKEQRFLYQQPCNSKQNFNDCFVGDKTIHVVQVLDGLGDLVHFVNWFEQYCFHRNVKNTTVIITLGERSAERNVIDYLNNMDKTHPLKNHPDLIICHSKDVSKKLFGVMFESSTKLETNRSQSYKALYCISTPPFHVAGKLHEIPQLGLTTCLINEMGTLTTKKKNLANFYEYSFGISHNNETKPIGCFFRNPEPAEKLEPILARLSNTLKSKLFGNDATNWTPEQLLDKANQVTIVCAYFVSNRDLNKIEKLTKKIGSKVLVFFTGTDASSDNYPFNQILKSNANGHVVCGKLNKTDYKDLIQLIRTDAKHWFLCAGDNTFIESISIGKLPIFLHRNSIDTSKERAIKDFLSTLEVIFHNFNHKDRQYIVEIISYLQNNTQELPSIAARDFFAKNISSYICEHYNLSRNISGMLINVENNHEDFRFGIQNLDDSRNKLAVPRKKYTPMFEICHYLPTSKPQPIFNTVSTVNPVTAAILR